jgi:hypothetical protein
MNDWLLLILSLPTENATVRMRAWRAVKASGAVVLRDGVYLLPARESCRLVFQDVAADVIQAKGTAFVLDVAASPEQNFPSLFDRSGDYARLAAEIEVCHRVLSTGLPPADAAKQMRKLRKSFTTLAEIDFFPTAQQAQADIALGDLEKAIHRLLTPDEPSAVQRSIPRLDRAEFRGRTWATRRRPWVDRLASAWLIRRHIDPEARLLWLASISDCPPDVLGFDFDGATFTHVDGKVTFETLQASFSLDDPALNRIGALVHCLDAGGIRPAEASGIERVLAGLREMISEDDRLFEAASAVFDGLYAAFRKEEENP